MSYKGLSVGHLSPMMSSLSNNINHKPQFLQWILGTLPLFPYPRCVKHLSTNNLFPQHQILSAPLRMRSMSTSSSGLLPSITCKTRDRKVLCLKISFLPKRKRQNSMFVYVISNIDNNFHPGRRQLSSWTVARLFTPELLEFARMTTEVCISSHSSFLSFF